MLPSQLESFLHSATREDGGGAGSLASHFGDDCPREHFLFGFVQTNDL